MKNRIVFPTLIVLSLGTWLVAQRPPPGPPEFARPAAGTGAEVPPPSPLSTNQVEDMLRALRRAMTNQPSAETGTPAPAATAVPATAPSAGVPTPTPGTATSVPSNASPSVALPSSTTATTTNQPITFPPSLTPGVPNVAVPGQSSPLPLPGGAAVPAAQVAPGAGAAQPDQILQKALVQIQGMKLDQFFEIYAMVSGRTVLRPYQMAGAKYQDITLKAETDWTTQEAIYAMDSVLAMTGVAMIPIGEKFVKAVPFAEAHLEGAGLAKTNVVEEMEGDQFVTRTIEVKTLKPSELAQVLGTFTRPNGVTAFDANNTLVLRDYASNVQRMMELIERIDVLRESDYKLEVIPIKYGKVEDLYNTMSSLISGQAQTAVAGAGAPTASRAGGSRLGGGTFGRGGAGGAFGQQQYRQPGGYGGGSYYPQQATPPQTVGGAQTSFQQRLQQIVNRAAGGEAVQLLQDARIVPDLRSNSLLIFANKRDVQMITNIVSKVDVLLAQVLIEAIILEVQLTDSHTLGVSMLQNPRRFGADFTGAGGVNNGQAFLNNITNLSGGLPSGFSYFGKFGNELDMALTAIANDSTVNVISRPRLQTSHAIPGEFVVAEAVPYVTGSYSDYYGGIGGGLGTRSIVQTAQIGITLSVTPFITPEGLVVMEITQEASQRGVDVIIDGNPIPVVNQRGATATLTVRDGQSIMMGGYITESRNKSNSGVPVLKDIPLLGALFRSKNKSNNRSELIVLMKATVLRTPEIASEVAADEKSQLPGVQQAEEEFRKDAEKRMQKLKPPTKRGAAVEPRKQTARAIQPRKW